MKLPYIITCSIFLLTGCQTTSSMKNSISFVVGPSQHGLAFVFKNNWPECGNLTMTPDAIKKQKYITSYNSCKVEPEGYVPQQIIIEYAPWLTYEEQQKIPELRAKETFLYRKKISPDTGNLVDEMIGRDEDAIEYNSTVLSKNVQAAIDKLSPTTWKKIVIYPPQTVKNWEKQPRWKDGKMKTNSIDIIVTLKPDGTHSIQENFYWKEPFKIDMR